LGSAALGSATTLLFIRPNASKPKCATRRPSAIVAPISTTTLLPTLAAVRPAQHVNLQAQTRSSRAHTFHLGGGSLGVGIGCCALGLRRRGWSKGSRGWSSGIEGSTWTWAALCQLGDLQGVVSGGYPLSTGKSCEGTYLPESDSPSKSCNGPINRIHRTTFQGPCCGSCLGGTVGHIRKPLEINGTMSEHVVSHLVLAQFRNPLFGHQKTATLFVRTMAIIIRRSAVQVRPPLPSFPSATSLGSSSGTSRRLATR
jgi:hypothetical protein